ncbi:MAG: sugar phosphate isomerase/epimerase, partial [Chloroflexi bacterium]|nr:sugar phosphate isomerase/epimerase [Chloroflexota bacterium]
LIIENEHTCNVATSTEIDAFLTEVATPTVRALWDPCNAFWSGEDDAVSSGYDRVKSHIAHVHVKDAVIEGGKHVATVLGEGNVGVQGQLDRLIHDGYAGFTLSLTMSWSSAPVVQRSLPAVRKGRAVVWLPGMRCVPAHERIGCRV